MNRDEIRSRLQGLVMATPVIDAHTHVQDDLIGFSAKDAAGKLEGTQAAVNRPSKSVVEEADVLELRGLLENHLRHTGSTVARRLLYNWSASLKQFVKIMPTDYKRALAMLASEPSDL